MKKIYSIFLALFVIGIGFSKAQQVTLTYVAPSSVTVDNVGNYGTPLNPVTFTQGMFSQGCVISDVDVVINWAKTAGTCTSPTGGNSYHGETSFRIDGPVGNQFLAVPNTWSGNVSTNSVVTTFSQQAGTIPSGTPVTGTFLPNNGDLNAYNGLQPFGSWNVSAGDNAAGDPLCIVYYQVAITTTPDLTNPVFTSFPSNFNVNASAGNCSAVVSWSTPVATDGCGTPTISLLTGLGSGSAFPVGTSTVTYRATDYYGNFTNASFTVTVTDNQNPTIACPANLTVNAPNGTCAANVNFTTPTALDNCPGATVLQIAGPTSGSSFPVGQTTVSFRTTDASLNTANCSFTVEVLDIQDPSITCPANISTLSTTGSCGAVVSYSTPAATDNCPGVSTALTAGFPSGATFPSGTTTVTYMGFDASGNDISCSFNVTVTPNPNGTLSLSPTSVCQGQQTVLTFTFTSGTGLFNVSFTDGITVFNANGVTSGSTYPITPPTSVTYSYTAIQDASGCVRTSGFIGTAAVVVTPQPVVSFTGLDPVYCETDATATLTANQNGGLFIGTGINDLGGGSATFDPALAGPTGPYSITYTFTDINNCTSSTTQSVLVDEQPVVNAGSGGSECDLDFGFSAVASVGVGTWSTISGPGLPFFSNVNSPSSLVQVSAYGSYVFRWTEVNGECSDFEEVTVNFYQVPSPNPGFGGSECDLDFQLGATPSVGVGTWSASGPGTASFAPSANDPNAVVTVSTYGTYSLTWTENNNGCSASASVNVAFAQLSVADAGNGGNECDLSFTFSAVPTVGVGLWTGTGPGAVTFNAPNSPTSNVTVSNYGTYTFTWTETNGDCVSNDQVVVNFYQQPNTNAGTGGDECDLNFTFNAVASVGVGTWTAAGPGTSIFGNASSATSTVSVSQYGTYNFTWTEVNGTCSDAETVTVNFYQQPVSNAGTGGNECDLNFSLNGIASVGVGLWTSTGPGSATFSNDLSASSTVTVSSYGTYTFTWTEISGTCVSSSSVTVNFYQQPVANAGVGGNECDLNFLLASTPSVGSGVWTAAGPGTANFNNANSPVSVTTVSNYGSYQFTWTETNGTCSNSQSVMVNFYEQPLADAGTGGVECDLNFTLSGVPSVGTGVWTATGPGTSVFADASDPISSVSVSQSGVYTFTWTETNGTCQSSDAVSVTFYDQPIADAGTGGNECDLNFTFSGSPSFGVGTWTYTGPGTAFFGSLNSVTTTAVVDAYGTYQFTWTEVNGVCSDAATITVVFDQQPVANAGVGGSECDLDFVLNAVPTIGSGVWSFAGSGNAVFAPNATTANATVTVDATGPYSFVWTENNNGCIDSETINVFFNPLPVVSFTGLAANYCVDQTTLVPLTGTPSGGTFSGLGISGNGFVPSIAGVGTIFLTYTFTDGNGCTNSETQTVDVNGLPTVTYSGLASPYCVDDAIAYPLVGNPTGGSFAGPGISGNNFTPTAAGAGTHGIVYSYTDPFGCSSSNTQSVTVNPLPVVSFSGLASSYCQNATSAQLTGNPSGGIFSGTGVIGASFSPATAGVGTHDITYTYTDANGCTNLQVQPVVVNTVPVPVVSPAGTSEICSGSSLVLDAGSGYSTYSWSNLTNGQTTTVTTAGTYNVTVVSAQGCSATSASIQLIVNQSPTVDLGNDTTICTGSVLNLNAGNSGSTYSWSTFEISQSINVTTTGAYTVQVTNANGCVGTDNIAVTVTNLLDPVIVASGPLNFCSGGSVSLDAGAGYDSYLWSTGAQTQSITVTTPGVVELQVWDQFGCGGQDEAVISVFQLPNAVVSPAGSVSICEGDTLTISTGSNFASYTWNPNGETSSSIDVYQSGSYSVVVEDPNNGCQSTSNVVSVTVNTVTPPTIVPSGPTSFCLGETVSLSVVPGPYNSYLWTTGSTTPSIVVGLTSDIGVSVLDGNNCLDSTLLGSPIHIEVWDPTPIAIQQGDSIVVTNGPFVQYQWYLNGAPIPGATGSVYYPTIGGNYEVEAIDVNQCVGTSFNVEFNFTGIFSQAANYDVNLYPNPTNGQFVVEVDLGSTMDVQLKFRDLIGREIIMPEWIQDVSNFRRSFDIGHLDSGVYFLEISTSHGTTVRSIVKD